MDSLTIILAFLALLVGIIGVWYTYRGYKHSISDKVTPNSMRTKVASTEIIVDTPQDSIIFLLLLDQFPIGLWGASLESTADLYGHIQDPGSITVSTHACLALSMVSGSSSLHPIQDYRKYLLSRRSQKGAFGMLREKGTPKYPDAHILEHTRHTATALRYFLYFDGVEHFCVVDALRYLLLQEVRTPSGVWVDYGEKIDERADPVTVAFVIGALEGVRAKINDSSVRGDTYAVPLSSIDSAIQIGLDYVFSTTLRTNEGFWYYRFHSELEKSRVWENLYQYTTDVLSQICHSSVRLGKYLDDIDNVVTSLVRISSTYKGGLPRSPSHNIPHLDSTARLIESMTVLGFESAIVQKCFEKLLHLLEKPEVIEEANANGWSSVLLLAKNQYGGVLRISEERINELYQGARVLLEIDEEEQKVPVLPGVSKEYVASLVWRLKGIQPK